MNSLRNNLLAWLLGAVALVGAAGAWVSYRNALNEANAFFDEHLRATAMLLRDQAYGYSNTPGLPQEIPDYDFVVQVWTLDGVRVYLSRPHAVLPGLTTLGLSTAATPQGRWRVFGVEANGRVIQVAQPMNVREQRAAHLALRTIAPFALLLPALALLVVWIVGRAVRPVRRFADVLRDRERDALDPLDGDGLPDEIRPVATALNDLLARLKESVERERSFIADAAHELRTPLTALDLQVQSLRAEAAGGGHDDAIARLEAGVARAARLVEQLLALAREERDGTRVREPVALADAARDAIGEMLSLADKHRIDLGMGRSDAVQVAGRPGSAARPDPQPARQRHSLFAGRQPGRRVRGTPRRRRTARRAGRHRWRPGNPPARTRTGVRPLSSGARHGRPRQWHRPGAGALDRGTPPRTDTPRRRPWRTRLARTGRFSRPRSTLSLP